MTNEPSAFRFENIERLATEAGSAWQARLQIAPDLPFLAGHFPAMPIVPAVAILEASRAFVASIGGPTARRVVSARHCKFKRPIGPGDAFIVRASSAEACRWTVTWTALAQAENIGDGESIVEIELTTRA